MKSSTQFLQQSGGHSTSLRWGSRIKRFIKFSDVLVIAGCKWRQFDFLLGHGGDFRTLFAVGGKAPSALALTHEAFLGHLTPVCDIEDLQPTKASTVSPFIKYQQLSAASFHP
jgi:hypothetical protein